MKKILINLKHFHRWIWILLIGLSSCAKSSPEDVDGDSNQNEIVIDFSKEFQTIRNFGASDAWGCQFIGLWPDDKRNQVADWLFSSAEDANGNPKGIGLSLWRFNIGAGSADQSNISDEWRRAEGFLQNSGEYDWTKQAGQRWFMQAARQRGVDQFVGFSNSPPVQLTINGKAYSSNGERANINPENYVRFAKFLTDVAKHFNDEGIALTYLSPFNEPQWDWTGNGQEGSPYTNEEIFLITKKLDSVIVASNAQVKIQIAEAGKLNYLYEKADKATRGEQIRTFFHESSPLFLGNLPSVDKVISGHSYFTSAPASTLKTVRDNVREHLKDATVPLEFWQSEYCVLGDQEEIKAEGKDTGIEPALYIARLIHHDLAIANASAWHWWLAVSVYDYKDGLVYASKQKSDGTVEDSKTLWALGNYSRFIRPGSVRVSVHSDNRDVNNVRGTMVSAYINKQQSKAVVVIVNNGSLDSSITLKVNEKKINSWTPYLTGPLVDQNLKRQAEIAVDSPFVVPVQTIMTLVGDIVD